MSVQEARVAVALLLHPDLKGLRQIEVASGLCDDTLLKVIPQSGFSSDLITCVTRGVHSWDQDDRRPMVLEYRTHVGRRSDLSLQDLEDLRERSLLETHGDDEALARHVSDFLDPSLDTWANTGSNHLGDAGWALAVISLFRSMTFSLGEMERILKVGARQVHRVLDRLNSWVTKSRVGRAVRVTLDMSLMLMTEPRELKASRKARKARQAQCEALEERARDTEIGRTVKELWANRVAEVKQLREYLVILPLRACQRIERMIRELSAGPGEGPMSRRALRRILDPLSV